MSTETVRFLNHIERERNSAVAPLKLKIESLQHDLSIAREIGKNASSKNTEMESKISILETQLSAEKINAGQFLDNIKKLLLKLRIDIYSTRYTTPRFFKSGKWWSRETGNFSQDDLDGLTRDELIEAFEFYCDTDLPFLAKSSMRDELAGFESAKILWYRYEAITESERSSISFPQFCGQARKEYKENLKKEIEYSEKIAKMAE